MTGADFNARLADNVQKLVRNLSGPEASQQDLRKRERTAWEQLRRYHFTSTNHFEVRRIMNDLVERFRVEGMSSFGETLMELANKVLAIPGHRGMGQPDMEWSLLDFLLAMTNEPVQNIRRDRELMTRRRLRGISDVKEAEMTEKRAAEAWIPPNSVEAEVDWVALLSEDFLEPPDMDSSDSLSDWSDESDNDSTSTLHPEENMGTSLALPEMAHVYEQAMQVAVPNRNGNGNTKYLPPECAVSETASDVFRITQPQVLNLNGFSSKLKKSKLLQLPALQPPAATTELQTSDRNTDVLQRTIHNHWWREDVKVFALPAEADPLANFAVSYVQFLNHSSRGLLNLPLPKTVTESCLVREILLMFVRPESCCFFELNSPERRILVRPNVSICTVSARALKRFLEYDVVPALEDMMELRRIIDAYTLAFDGSVTGTLECFAYGLRDLVRPISQLLIAFEERVVREPAKSTLVHFVFEFRPHFRQLKLLRSLAKDAILERGPPHLRSAYLLSRLYNHTKPQVLHQKLATALLLVSLKRYCNIIDSWWRRATLEDRLNEFIVERWVEEDTERSGYVRKRCVSSSEGSEAVEIFKKLHECPFYQLLLKHALESGETQDLLANVNLLGDMLANNNESQPRSLYEELTAQLFAQLRIYCSNVPTDEEAQPEGKKDLRRASDEQLVKNAQGIHNLDLMAIFTRPARERILERQRHSENKTPMQVMEVFRRLEQSTCLQLKDELPEALRKLLQRRQCLANEYAMRAYCVDLQLGEVSRFLRHTMMLEAYYLLLPFYTALFTRIEKSEDWAQNSRLNAKLYEVLFPHYAHLADNLQLKVISKVACVSNKVHEAVDALELYYDLPVAMQRVVTPKHMQGYNSVWRLMLKVKWAVWKLENLVFLRRLEGNPYAPLDLLGLTIRRLEILRFWMIYVINSLHTHIMQVVGQQFELQIGQCQNIRELRTQHDEHVLLLRTHCLLTDEFTAFRNALDQLFHLVFVLDMEWTCCTCYLGDNDALSLDVSQSENGDAENESNGRGLEYLALNQVVEIEMTYIRCHQTLAEILNSLVYKHDYGFLTALEVAFNTSVPY
ncbi:uncharacterized protein LOC108094617 [Drosophila ficusphila]|uniref:uncharacterized protein LOC108094617 n=1 Tax=Drosophila ficusphila TaxID=30025 RepID=UPI0007E6EF00|nr:uncharacterized protein LOC108094617 [Drosophila ficusphila]